MKHTILTISLLLFFGLSYGQLLAHYPMDGNAEDKSGNGFHGSLMGGPLLTVDHMGNNDGAYYFNGSNQFIRLGDIFDDVWAADTAKFTITGWFKLNTLPATGYCQFIIAKSAGGTGPYQWYVMVWDDATLRGVMHSTTSTANLGTAEWLSKKSTSAVSTNNWYHFAFVVDGSLSAQNRVKIYLDGVEGGFASSNGTWGRTTVNTAQEVTIGAGHVSNSPSIPNNQFNGAIDDIKIFRGAMTKNEIGILMGFQSPIRDYAGLSIYPNPTVGNFNFTIRDPKTVNGIDIIDILGRNILSYSGDAITKMIEVPSLPKGIYNVCLKYDGGVVVKKVVVQ